MHPIDEIGTALGLFLLTVVACVVGRALFFAWIDEREHRSYDQHEEMRRALSQARENPPYEGWDIRD